MQRYTRALEVEMSRVSWEKYKAKGILYFIIVFGLRFGFSSALFAILFKNIGTILIYNNTMDFGIIANDISSIGILFFLLGSYLNWKGYEQQYG